MKLGELVKTAFAGALLAGISAPGVGETRMPEKQFAIAAEDIKPLAQGHGGAIASDRITVEGLPVRFMYREAPSNPQDSGWRFLSGTEDDAYMDDATNHGVYDVNTIANYDPTIIPYLDHPVGSVFEKLPDATEFTAVTDWGPPAN